VHILVIGKSTYMAAYRNEGGPFYHQNFSAIYKSTSSLELFSVCVVSNFHKQLGDVLGQ
jgi:hypothetical protein